MHYLRLYSDVSGETHFEEVSLPTHEERIDAPWTVITEVTDAVPASGVQFRRVLEEDRDGAFHVAPQRQFVVTLAGEMQYTVSDGEQRTLGPGSVLLVEDVEGKGHLTRRISAEGRVQLFIPLQ